MERGVGESERRFVERRVEGERGERKKEQKEYSKRKERERKRKGREESVKK